MKKRDKKDRISYVIVFATYGLVIGFIVGDLLGESVFMTSLCTFVAVVIGWYMGDKKKKKRASTEQVIVDISEYDPGYHVEFEVGKEIRTITTKDANGNYNKHFMKELDIYGRDIKVGDYVVPDARGLLKKVE